jgi:nucleoid-associated protein YgaU
MFQIGGSAMIVNKKNFILLTCGAIAYLIFFAGFVHAQLQKNELTIPTYKTIVVKEGDTLWEIADQYNDEKDIPVQEMVEQILHLNGLSNAKIFPGQQIKIPD